MIYYILLICASLLFGSQFMVVNGYQKKNGGAVEASIVLSLVEGIFAFIIFFIASLFISNFKVNITPYGILYSILLAAVGITCGIVGIKTLSLGDVKVYTLFIMAGGMIVPFIVGVVFLNEALTLFNVLGIILMTFMLFIPLFDKTEKIEKKSKKDTIIFYILCFLLFLTNGLSSVFAKLHQVSSNPMESAQFTSLYFGITAIACSIVFTFMRIFIKAKNKKNAPLESNNNEINQKPKSSLNKYALIFGLLYAIVNGSAQFLNLYSAKEIPATAQFPIVTGGTIIFSFVLSRLIFKEKATKIQLIQVATALIATILFVL